MANLVTEVFTNGITEGFDKHHSYLKNLFSPFSNINSNTLNKLNLIKDDFLFKNIGNDILVKILNKPFILKAIKKYNYKKIDKKDYPFAEYNYAGVKERISFIKELEEKFSDKVTINKKEFTYFIQENFLVFLEENGDKVKYFYDISGVKIQDLKIDSSLFVYILCSKNNNQYIIKTHLSKNFAEYNKKDSALNSNEVFYSIFLTDNINEFYDQIINVESNSLYLTNNEGLYKIDLIKKYYFFDENYIYFNSYGELDLYKKYFIEEIQTNFSNIYNFQNLLGLNEFKIKDRKISSFEMDVFLNLFKNKFDNTFNGGTNYFLIKNYYDNYNDLNKETFKLYPDYQININDDIFSINGNFNYNLKNGEYKIIIKDNEISLNKKNKNSYIFLEKCEIVNPDEFYFFHLKFQLKTFTLPNNYSFDFTVKDNYIFKQESVKKNLNVFFNNKRNLNSLLNKDTNMNNEKVYFKNNKIIFENLFNWNKKEFIYNNIKDEVTANKPYSVKNIKKFYCSVNYDVKEDFLFPRNNGAITYSNLENISFDLINEKGFISDFWKKYSEKEIYFKNKNNQIIIIDNLKEADFSVKIPKISDYIHINLNEKNIDISVNDEREFVFNKKENLLLTTKYENEPLFYKVFIDNSKAEDVSIFDNEDNFVSNFSVENYKNGTVFYFNAENNKKYYYSLKNDTGKNYFKPIKSFENIINFYEFDETKTIRFSDLVNLTTLELSSSTKEKVKLNLFLYNTKNGDTKKIEINEKALNKTFDVNFSTNLIKIESEYEVKDLILLEKSNNSIEDKDKIIYFKEKDTDICYLSEEKEGIVDLSSVIDNIQINKKYKYYKNKLIESNNGNIYLKNILDDSIFIKKLNKEIKVQKNIFKSFSTTKTDKFYIENFKSFNIEHEFLNKELISISKEDKEINL